LRISWPGWSQAHHVISKILVIKCLSQLDYYEDDLDWKSKKNLIDIIVSTQEKFIGRKGGKFMFSIYNPKSQAAITIKRLIFSHSEYQEKLELGKELLTEKVPFKFSEEILRWFKIHQNDEDRLFHENDIITLNEILLQRALSQCDKNKTNLFVEFEDNIFGLLRFWYDINQKDLYRYFKKLLDQKPEFIKELIFSLTTTIISSTYPDPYKTDLKKETYENLKLYYDVEKIHNLIVDNFKDEIDKAKNDVIFFDTNRGQTELNAIRQFLFWYSKDSQEKDGD